MKKTSLSQYLIIIFATFVVMVSLIGCNKNEQPNDISQITEESSVEEALWGKVSGRVIDSETGEGLPNVAVKLTADEIGSDDPIMLFDGTFVFIANGHYEIVFTLEGYEPVTLGYDVKPGEELDYGEIQMTRIPENVDMSGFVLTDKHQTLFKWWLQAIFVDKIPGYGQSPTVFSITKDSVPASVWNSNLVLYIGFDYFNDPRISEESGQYGTNKVYTPEAAKEMAREITGRTDEAYITEVADVGKREGDKMVFYPVGLIGDSGPYYFKEITGWKAEKDRLTLTGIVKAMVENKEWTFEAVFTVGSPDAPIPWVFESLTVDNGNHSGGSASGSSTSASGNMDDLSWICQKVVEHYNREYEADIFVVFENEASATNDGYDLILRTTGGSSANALFGLVSVNTATGEVEDEFGNRWNLNSDGSGSSAGTQSGMTWQSAYREYLAAEYMYADPDKPWTLVYINDDNIPELAVGVYGTGNGSRIKLYTYDGTGIVDLGEVGNYGSFYYARRENLIQNSLPASSFKGTVYIQEIKNDKLHTLWIMTMDNMREVYSMGPDENSLKECKREDIDAKYSYFFPNGMQETPSLMNGEGCIYRCNDKDLGQLLQMN